MARMTTVSIEGDSFYINGKATYDGCTFNGMKIEGLLMNSRMVQATFDDLNSQTREQWRFPDGAPFDANRNTSEFIAMMPEYRRRGLLAVTLNLQGGSPYGYSDAQPWHNSAIEADGTVRADYLSRLERVLDRADELGMVIILGLFYFGQDERVADEAAVVRGVQNATDWLVTKAYTNVLVEITNEADVKRYEHPILTDKRCHELIELVQQRSCGKVANPKGRLLAGTSMSGGTIPPDAIVAVSDFILPHGNGVREPSRIREMCDEVRALGSYRGQPIFFNEDDHFDFDKGDNNMLAAIGKHASWGFFDYRMKGEGFEQGYQSIPADWGINSARKKGFFDLTAKVTGAR